MTQQKIPFLISDLLLLLQNTSFVIFTEFGYQKLIVATSIELVERHFLMIKTTI